MHTYIYTYIHTYIHPHIHTYVHAYIHTYIHPNIHPYIHAYIHTHIHTPIHTYVLLRTYHLLLHTATCYVLLHTATRYVLLHTHTYVRTTYVHTYIHPHIHIHTRIHTYIHTPVHTYIHTKPTSGHQTNSGAPLSVVFVSVVLRSADTCSTPGWCTSHADEAPRWTPRTFAKYPTANESHRRCRGEHRERLSTHHWYEFRMYGGLKWEGWTSFNQIISMFTVGCFNVSHIRVGGGVWLQTKHWYAFRK
jgi:hypothetical protein